MAADGGSVNRFKVSSAAFVECSPDCNGAITEHRGILGGAASICITIEMDDDEPSLTTQGPPQQDKLAKLSESMTGVSGWSHDLGS